MTRTETRRFLKLTIGTELRTQLVTSMNVRRGPANDNRDFEPVVRKGHFISQSRSEQGTRATTTRTTTSS